VGQKVKGGMYCDRCDRPVAAVKNTHRIRNAAGVLALPATGGLSAAGMKGERYLCPLCGGHVHAGHVRKSSAQGSHTTVAERSVIKARKRAERLAREGRTPAPGELPPPRPLPWWQKKKISTALQPQPEATQSSADSPWPGPSPLPSESRPGCR